MPYPAVPYKICPCCGTEFGVDDRLRSLFELREAWIGEGMPWFDDVTSPPIGWNPALQLLGGKHAAELIKQVAESTVSQVEPLKLEGTFVSNAQVRVGEIHTSLFGNLQALQSRLAAA